MIIESYGKVNCVWKDGFYVKAKEQSNGSYSTFIYIINSWFVPSALTSHFTQNFSIYPDIILVFTLNSNGTKLRNILDDTKLISQNSPFKLHVLIRQKVASEFVNKSSEFDESILVVVIES